MKWIHKLTDLFKEENVQQLKTEEILFAFNDPTVRKLWLQRVFQFIVDLNRDVDLRLTKNHLDDLSDLAFKRQAIQAVLDAVLEAKRQAKGHNPQKKGEFDLESVTVQPV